MSNAPSPPPKQSYFFSVTISPDFRALVQEHSQAVNYFHRKLMELDEVWMERELSVNVTEHDILSDLTIGKLLERPVKRPVHFEN